MSRARIASGTTPPGTAGERQSARWVQQMFSRIAPRYDFLNHLLSFGIDRKWRKVLMNSLQPVLDSPDAAVLDLCCGTGDVLLEFQAGARAHIMGADFCHPMLVAAREKASHAGLRAALFEADALELPLAADSLDAIAISFGFRNLANYREGLIEMQRVLRPGGTLAILEFSHPPGMVTKASYGFYSRVILPLIGTAISGSSQAYTYLPASIRKFPPARDLEALIQAAGFVRTEFHLLSGGIAALHLGRKSAAGGAGQAAIDFIAQAEVPH